MNKKQLFFAIIMMGAVLQTYQVHAEDYYTPKVIYGEDNRKDIYEVTNANHLKWAKSTVALISKYDIRKDFSTGDYNVTGDHYGNLYNLCQDEPFREQMSTAYCSGFLVKPNVIVTAGHCLRAPSDCLKTKFVFDFSIKNKGDASPTTISGDNVYECQTLVHRKVDGQGADFAVVRLDRPVIGREPLKFRTSGSVAPGDALTVIGHPAGIPTKVADGANVRNLDSDFFVANLDTYGGNSGSAVINSTTGEVEGILVRGERDFEQVGQCRKSYACKDDGCRGEDVTEISATLPYLNK